ncbi:SDR family NAD(P)-dependent oxidoreductase [Actinophytocola sp.]|uniref:SDR family NAD(P)-dependent oxidoreductase n=1 Tax=Actinophytocola sp. TaxID=1872138 RepID=UPI002ED039E2
MAVTDQHKIGSGFGFRSTAAEVMDGIDLTGTLAIVTGGYSGIGIETTKALTKAGAFVVVPARRADKAAEALAGLSSVEVVPLDLGDLSSVRAFADGFLASGRSIDLVINSAGVMACPETRVGRGWEAQFATNHLGHYALVNRLWPALRPGARVVAVSSAAHRYSAIRWDDVMFDGGYEKWAAYGQSKTANALFAAHLDLLALDAGVRAFSVHPGGILTPLQRHMAHEELVERGIFDEAGNPNLDWLKTPEQGAATQLWAATSPQLADLGGVYLEDCDVAEIRASDDMAAKGVYPYAVDPDEAARLWTLSAELTGVNAFTRG